MWDLGTVANCPQFTGHPHTYTHTHTHTHTQGHPSYEAPHGGQQTGPGSISNQVHSPPTYPRPVVHLPHLWLRPLSLWLHLYQGISDQVSG